MRISFYHLQRWPLETALPKILEKLLAGGHKGLVMTGSAERKAFLDSLLWTYEPESWLPHGQSGEPDAALQPILLTDGAENLNQADILVLTDGVLPERLEGFERCLMLFDGRDEDALAAARAQWKEWKAQGHEMSYLQQTERGWQEMTN